VEQMLNTSELYSLQRENEIFRKKKQTHTSVERDLGGIDLSGSMWVNLEVIRA